MISASYRLHDSDAPDGRPRIEVVCGLSTEYGQLLSSGGYQTWNTEPYITRRYPLAERIELERQHDKVYRRRIIVVEEWTEVDAP